MRQSKIDLKTISITKWDEGRLWLSNLKEIHNACSFKLSTEDAAMSFRQIARWAERSIDIFPAIVKIGGPNARSDIKELTKSGVEGLIAPMIESPYALENFITALESILDESGFNAIKKHINIETQTGIHQLDEILNSSFIGYIDEITIGMSDLSHSMKTTVSNPELLKTVTSTIRKIHQYGLKVSIGGGITPRSIDSVLSQLRPDKFNTRVITFPCDGRESFSDAVLFALEFEKLMLSIDHKEGFLSTEEWNTRDSQISKRLQES